MVPAYRQMRRRTLKLRPEITLLPAREALLEFVVRLSLGQRKIPLPKKHSGLGGDLRAMVQLLGERGATVEDTAEAALRIYARLAKLKNDYLDENEFVIQKAERRSSSRSKRSSRSNRWVDKEVTAENSVLPSLAG